MTITTTAYAVLVIDTTTAKPVIVGTRIFSEPQPTATTSTHFAELFRCTAVGTYGVANRLARKALADARYDWIGDYADGCRVPRMPLEWPVAATAAAEADVTPPPGWEARVEARHAAYEQACAALVDDAVKHAMTTITQDLTTRFRRLLDEHAALIATTDHCDSMTTAKPSDGPPLEDTFTGTLELTASELTYIRHAITELYVRGEGIPRGVNRRAFIERVNAKLATLKLDRMVTPDGSRLVSVATHDAVVADLVTRRPPPTK